MIDLENFDVANPADSMKETIPEHETNVLQQCECVNNMIVAYYLKDASDRIEVFDLEGKLLNSVGLPGIGTVLTSSGKHDSTELLFKFTSFSDPGSIYRVDMNSFDVECIGTTQLSDKSLDISEFATD